MDLDIEAMLDMSAEILEEYIRSKSLAEQHLDILSQYLHDAGERCEDQKKSISYFRTAKLLIELIGKYSDIMTFERIRLKDQLNRKL